MEPVKMTSAQYQAKFGVPPPTKAVPPATQKPVSSVPIKMTGAQYQAKFGTKPSTGFFQNAGKINKQSGSTVAAGTNDAPGSIKQYSAQSAQPASTAANPSPGWWKRLWAGTPLAPAGEQDTGFTEKNGKTIATGSDATTMGERSKANLKETGSALVEGGKMIANIVSDAPAAAGGLLQLLEPWKYPAIAEGLIKGVSSVSKETFGAVKQGIETGDWSRLNEDASKAEITVVNHPLQSALFFDGAIEGFGEAGDVARDLHATATDPSTSFSDTPTGKQVSDMKANVSKARDNIVDLFKKKTTLTEHTIALGKLTDETIKSNKEYTDAQKTVESFNDQNKKLVDEQKGLQEKLSQSLSETEGTKNKVKKLIDSGIKSTEKEKAKTKADLQSKIDENQAKQTELKQNQLNAQKKLEAAKDQAKENLDNKTDEVNRETSNQQKEMKLKNGFNSSVTEMGQAVEGFFKSAFNRASGVYDENLGNAKMDASEIISGLEKYKTKLLEGNKFKSADGAQTAIDRLKFRDIVNSGKSDTEIFKALDASGLPKKSFYTLDIDALKERYKPLTSENLKTSKNAIYNDIEKGADESSLKEYNDHVTPMFNKVFDNAVKDTYGQTRLDTLKQNDGDWAELKKNPLSSEAKLSLDKISENWDSFVKAANKVQGGPDLVSKIQNFTGEHILNNSENIANKGTFDFKKILKGISEYGNVLDDTTKERLQRVADDNKNIAEEKANTMKQFQEQKKQFSLKQAQENLDLENQKKKTAREGKDQVEKISNKAKTIKEKGDETIESIKQKQDDIKQQQSKIAEDQKKTEQDAKDIGSDTPDFIKNVHGIDSPEKLTSFIEKSGKTAEEIGAVTIRQAFAGVSKEIAGSRIEPELDTKGNPILDKNGKQVLKPLNFSIDKVGEALDKVEQLGKGDQDVQNRLLGQTEEMQKAGKLSDTQEQLKKLRDQYEEWKKAKGVKSRTFMSRAANATLGAVMLAVLPFGKFYGIRKILSAFSFDESPAELNARARTAAPEGNKFSAKKAATLLKTGSILNTGKDNEED